MTDEWIILELIRGELGRQKLLKLSGRFSYLLSDPEMSDANRLSCIVEECGEVSRCVQRRENLVTDGSFEDLTLLAELTQLAALSCAWMKRLV